MGANIRRARDAKGLTQRQLAAKVNGVDTEAVSRWERGIVLPAAANFVVLASVLDHDVGWFYVDREEASAA